MPSSTAKYLIPYAQQADPVAQLPTTMQQQAARLDLLLGEAGQQAPAVAAGVVTSIPITLSRTYPGNALGSIPGTVIITPLTNVGAGVTCFYYITAWVGTASTVTGFTINVISSSATTRSFQWRFLPNL